MNRLDRPAGALSRGIGRITSAALGPYQTAVVRIGFSVTWLLFLLREFPHRHELYGPQGPWSWELANRLILDNQAFTALMWNDGRVWFECVYGLAVLSSVLLMLGWRTRTMSVLFMVGALSVLNRSVFVGDGGDNVIHLMAMYLVLTRCGQVWSLDARRAARAARARGGGFHELGEEAAEADPDRVGPVLWWILGLSLAVVTFLGQLGWGWALIFWTMWLAHGLWWLLGRQAPGSQLRALCDVVTNLLHNTALFVIMAEACLIYATAGWYKIQGSRWQDGTAVYYPLHLDYFSPWPALSQLLSTQGTAIMLITYGTVVVQVAFPFTLFNRRVKNVLLAAMMIEHAVIAVLLGLPFFSLAMIAADAVFLPTTFLRRIGNRAARARGAVFTRTRGVPEQRSEAGADTGGTGADTGGTGPVPEARTGAGAPEPYGTGAPELQPELQPEPNPNPEPNSGPEPNSEPEPMPQPEPNPAPSAPERPRP
ncbi:HTTM domain-containing protein [Streptomyces sp. B-S-A8]|uniref:HTTM domain-containing protein n=1 Tax=Streptomyces solicavernae TaxID=3043614 RepID=A0ABT6RK26_9ACTN|nr:HTTM domain-containing protein [Streptomyces sp. B-S-A8]MDI3384781.1 HTTM domain-containing protein [Streptomyces sp. B-S-A8]